MEPKEYAKQLLKKVIERYKLGIGFNTIHVYS